MSSISGIQSSLTYSQYSSQNTQRTTTTDFQSIMEERMKEIEEAVESGEIDVDDFKAKLEEKFGSAVDEAFSEDGTVDFDKLNEIIQEQLSSTSEANPSSMPPPPPPMKMDSTDLQSKLTEEFGDEAEGIVGEDGSIDFEKLKELLDSQSSTTTQGYQSAYSSQESLLNSFFLQHGSFLNVTA